jgi:hypothetical protein
MAKLAKGERMKKTRINKKGKKWEEFNKQRDLYKLLQTPIKVKTEGEQSEQPQKHIQMSYL